MPVSSSLSTRRRAEQARQHRAQPAVNQGRTKCESGALRIPALRATTWLEKSDFKLSGIRPMILCGANPVFQTLIMHHPLAECGAVQLTSMFERRADHLSARSFTGPTVWVTAFGAHAGMM